MMDEGPFREMTTSLRDRILVLEREKSKQSRAIVDEVWDVVDVSVTTLCFSLGGLFAIAGIIELVKNCGCQ